MAAASASVCLQPFFCFEIQEYIMWNKWFSGGMKTFIVIWSGQLVSQMGTAMTRFALLIWAYQRTGQATALALLGFFSLVPFVIATPIAGVLVDRWDRRRVLMLADTGAGLMTLVMLVLYSTGNLQIWHLYLAEAVAGVCEAFQFPAYSTSVTMLVPRDQLGRASGMRSLSYSLSRVVAPFLGGLLLTIIDINGVMLIDIATFVFAVSAVLLVQIPRPARSEAGEAAEGTMWQQIRFGFAYISARPGLVGLLVFFAAVNFVSALTYFGILPAMILARSGNSEIALAAVQSLLGIGGVLGGLAFSLWGGFRRRIDNILLGAAVSFMLGDLVFAFGRSLPFWMVAALMGEFWIPLIVGGDRAIWQTKVPADVQGRVLAAQSFACELAFPLGYLITGPLADKIMEPAMTPGGALAPIFGPLIGTGPGAGMALMFVFTGLCGAAVSLGCYLIRPLRNIEAELPDAVIESDTETSPVFSEASA
jgi:MFS family permease